MKMKYIMGALVLMSTVSVGELYSLISPGAELQQAIHKLMQRIKKLEKNEAVDDATAATILADITAIQTAATALTTRVTTAEGDITAIQTAATALAARVTALEVFHP